MPDYFVTFKPEHGHPGTLHPIWPPAHHDGWVKVSATTLQSAKVITQSHFGLEYSQIFTADMFVPSIYPLGQLAEINTIRHAPIEQSFPIVGEKTRGRRIVCSCSINQYTDPIPWATPGHGEKK